MQKESRSNANMQPGRLWPISTGCYLSLFLLHLRKFLETVCGKEKTLLLTKSCVPVSTVLQSHKHRSIGQKSPFDTAVSSTQGYHEVSCSLENL